MTSQVELVRPSGLWSAAVYCGHADELLAALDPDVPFVVVECGNPSLGWHDAPVTVGPEPGPRIRRVRNLSFDLLLSPVEAADLGPLVRAEHDGSLRCFQLDRHPPADFWLPDADRGRVAAMRGRGVHLIIELPHDGEVAVITSVVEETVEHFLGRFRNARSSDGPSDSSATPSH